MKNRTAVLASVLTLAVSSHAQNLSSDSMLASNALDPLVITASRVSQPRSSSAVMVDVITRQQIELSGASNITEFLDDVGGVSLTRLYGRSGVDASLDIGFMGESGSQNVLVLVDGQRLNAMDQSGVRFSQVPLSSIERIEIRKANGGALYGDRAQGGVINIITRTDAAKDLSLNLGSFGAQKIDAYLGFKTDDWRGSVSAVSAKVQGYRVHSNSDQKSAQLKLGTTASWGRFDFFLRGFEEKVLQPSYLTQDQFALNARQIGAYPAASNRAGGATGLRYGRVLGDGAEFSVNLMHQISRDKAYDNITNNRTAVTPELRAQLGAGHGLVGADFYESKAKTDGGKQAAQRSQSVYAHTTQPLQPALKVELGARTQWITSDIRSSVAGEKTSSRGEKSGLSAALRYQLSDQTVLRGGALKGFRFPNADELYYFDPSTYALLEINPTISPMSSKEIFLQMAHRFASGSVDLHYRNIRTADEIGYAFSCGLVEGKAASCNANLFDTERRVLSLNTRWEPLNVLTMRAGLDLVDASIDSGPHAGNRIPLTAKQMVRWSAEYRQQDNTWMAKASYRGHLVQASDPAATNALIPARTVVDLGVNRVLNNTWSASTWVRNAFNKNYYDYATFNGLYPADKRSLHIHLKASL